MFTFFLARLPGRELSQHLVWGLAHVSSQPVLTGSGTTRFRGQTGLSLLGPGAAGVSYSSTVLLG